MLQPTGDDQGSGFRAWGSKRYPKKEPVKCAATAVQ